jgi:hypothetical protein
MVMIKNFSIIVIISTTASIIIASRFLEVPILELFKVLWTVIIK